MPSDFRVFPGDPRPAARLVIRVSFGHTGVCVGGVKVLMIRWRSVAGGRREIFPRWLDSIRRRTGDPGTLRGLGLRWRRGIDIAIVAEPSVRCLDLDLGRVRLMPSG